MFDIPSLVCVLEYAGLSVLPVVALLSDVCLDAALHVAWEATGRKEPVGTHALILKSSPEPVHYARIPCLAAWYTKKVWQRGYVAGVIPVYPILEYLDGLSSMEPGFWRMQADLSDFRRPEAGYPALYMLCRLGTQSRWAERGCKFGVREFEILGRVCRHIDMALKRTASRDCIDFWSAMAGQGGAYWQAMQKIGYRNEYTYGLHPSVGGLKEWLLCDPGIHMEREVFDFMKHLITSYASPFVVAWAIDRSVAIDPGCVRGIVAQLNAASPPWGEDALLAYGIGRLLRNKSLHSALTQ